MTKNYFYTKKNTTKPSLVYISNILQPERPEIRPPPEGWCIPHFSIYVERSFPLTMMNGMVLRFDLFRFAISIALSRMDGLTFPALLNWCFPNRFLRFSDGKLHATAAVTLFGLRGLAGVSSVYSAEWTREASLALVGGSCVM